ncbi:MAG: ABC transporter ATP-binding protein [Gammaproteobacteria bacterium]
MFSQLFEIFSFLSKKLRFGWLTLLPLSIVVAGLESLGVILIFHTVQYMKNPDQSSIPSWLSFLPAGSFFWMAAFFVTVFAAKNLFLALFLTFRNSLAANTQAFLCRRLLKNYLQADYQFHLQRNSSELIRNITESVEPVCNLGFNGLVTLSNYIFIACAITSMLVILSPTTGLLILLLAGLLVSIIYLISRAYLNKQSEKTEKAKKDRLQTLTQLFGSFRELIISGKQTFWIKRFMNHQNEYVHSNSHALSATYAASLLMETLLITALMIMAGLFLSASQTQSELLFPVLGTYAYAAARLIPLASGISLHLGMVQYAQKPMTNVIDHLELPPRLSGETKINRSNKRQIKVSNLSFKYPAKQYAVLKNINFTVESGESVGIVGPSGSGKSTLMLLLLGILNHEEGEIRVCDHKLQEVSKSWQALIGYVPQEIYLLDDSIRANIAFGIAGKNINEKRLAEVVKQAHLDEVINSLDQGLQTIVGEHGMQLSGGQRQRLAIARALYNQPDFLFLDEATAALDVETEEVITRTLQELHGKLTILIIAHRESTLKHCDRILSLENGCLIEQNRHV